MDLLKALASEHSKAMTTRIIKWIGADQSRLDELVRLFLGNDRVISQRAGWPLSYVVEKHPALVQKHLRAILKNLRQPNLHEAVKWNTVRLLQFVEVPKALQGEVLNTCFDYITDPKEKPAIKAFSMGRNLAVVDVPKPKLHFGGFFAWLVWMGLHLLLILGVKNRISVFFNWVWSYATYDQNLRLIFREFYKPINKEKVLEKEGVID